MMACVIAIADPEQLGLRLMADRHPNCLIERCARPDSRPRPFWRNTTPALSLFRVGRTKVTSPSDSVMSDFERGERLLLNMGTHLEAERTRCQLTVPE